MFLLLFMFSFVLQQNILASTSSTNDPTDVISFEQSVPANATIIFVGTVTDFKVTLDDTAIANAAANPTDTTVLFGGANDDDNIPVCIANNNLQNGVQIKVTQSEPTAESGKLLVMEAANAIPGSSNKATIPVVLEWIPNGLATTNELSGAASENTIIGTSSHTLSSGSSAIAFTSSGATVHLDHFDTDSSSTNTYDSNANNQGCGAVPAYLKIFAKNEDIADTYADVYTIKLKFESITCTDISDDTDSLECT